MEHMHRLCHWLGSNWEAGEKQYSQGASVPSPLLPLSPPNKTLGEGTLGVSVLQQAGCLQVNPSQAQGCLHKQLLGNGVETK